MPAGFIGAFGMGIGSVPQVFNDAQQGMSDARNEINSYTGGKAFLARSLMLSGDFAFGSSQLAYNPVGTIGGMPEGFVNLGGKIGTDIYNIGADPSVNNFFNIGEDALAAWGISTGVSRGLTASGATAPLEDFAVRTYFNSVDSANSASLYNSFKPGTARLNFGFGGDTLFRSADDFAAASRGRFASEEMPFSPADSIQQNALAPRFGNFASQLFQVTSRPGFSVQGIVASQGVGLEGGATQVFQSRPRATVGNPYPSPWSSVQQVPYPFH
jgi:hypothetical protein